MSKHKPQRYPFVPSTPSTKTPAQQPQPSPAQQQRNSRGNFSLGGRRFNGQTTRKGSRH